MSSHNIPNDQFRRMLNDIGALALGQAYKGKVNLPQGREDASYNDYLVIPQQEYIEDYLECAKKLINLWPNIQKRPLKEISKQASWIAREKAVLTESGLKAFVKHTHKPKLLCQQNKETNNCSENKLLLQIVNALVERLAIVIRRDDGQGIDESLNPLQYDEKKQIEIGDMLKKLKHIRKSHFFDGVMDIYDLIMPTQRMLGTSGYSDIYNIFHQKVLAKEKDYPDVKKGFRKLRKLFFANISKDSKVYEIWCFLQLYKAFIVRAGFSTKTKIIDLLELKDDILIFKKGCCIFLSRGNIDSELSIKLSYEEKIYDVDNIARRPDYLVEITHKRTNEILNFVFDAKWRSYDELPHDATKGDKCECIRCDVYKVAYEKYFKKLTEEITASFILHSDDKKIDDKEIYEHWNGGSLFKWLAQPSDFKHSDIREHQIGAICLRPDNLLNHKLSKIVYMLLLYHVANRVQKVEECCPRCGSTGKVNTNNKYQSTERQCPSCHLQWWITNCTKSKSHRIVKLGDNKSFHVPMISKGQYKCPKCGDMGSDYR